MPLDGWWLAAAAVVLLIVAAPPAGTQRAPRAMDRVRIEMNGMLLAVAVVEGPEGDDVLLPVDALLRAVDGAQPGEPARLRREGHRLYAAGVGGCAGCLLRVARPVVISERVRVVDGITVVPLGDLVAALEGRVRRHADPRVREIFAGKCTWCILEPR